MMPLMRANESALICEASPTNMSLVIAVGTTAEKIEQNAKLATKRAKSASPGASNSATGKKNATRPFKAVRFTT